MTRPDDISREFDAIVEQHKETGRMLTAMANRLAESRKRPAFKIVRSDNLKMPDDPGPKGAA